MIVPVILIFCIAATISACVLHHHNHRKVFVGSVRLIASVAMYSSHLVVMVSSLPPIAPTCSWLFNIKLPNLVNVEKLCLVRISSCMHIQHTTHTLDTIHIAKASNTNKQLARNTCHSTCHSSHFLASSLWSAHGLLSHAIVLVVFVIINIEVGQTINHTKSGFDYFFSFDYRKFHFKSPTALQVFIIEDSNEPGLPSNNLEASFMLNC